MRDHGGTRKFSGGKYAELLGGVSSYSNLERSRPYSPVGNSLAALCTLRIHSQGATDLTSASECSRVPVSGV